MNYPGKKRRCSTDSGDCKSVSRTLKSTFRSVLSLAKRNARSVTELVQHIKGGHTGFVIRNDLVTFQDEIL